MNRNSASSKIVREQAEKNGSTGGNHSNGQTTKAPDTVTAAPEQDMLAAIAAVRGEIGRLHKELEAASDEAKPAIKAQLEALMKSVCLEIEPPVSSTTPDGDKPAGDQPAGGATNEEEKTGFFKRAYGWAKENKAKTAAIAVTVAAVAAAVVYAVRSGQTSKLAEAGDVLAQRATEAMDGMFSGAAVEAATDATVETAAADATAGKTSLLTRLGNGLDTAGGYMKSAWSFVSTKAIAGKDIVVGWFSSAAPVAAEVAPDVAMAAV